MTGAEDWRLVASAAGAAALLGPLGHLGARRAAGSSARWVGWAESAAAGMMLAMAYALKGDGRPPIQLAGAFLAIGLLATLPRTGPVSTQAVHSAFEGLALGVAFSRDVALGLVLAAIVGAHNLPEARSLQEDWPEDPGRATLWSLFGRAPQPLVALGTWAVLADPPGAGTELAAGAATGALVHLVAAELLPRAYRRTGPAGIAVVASLALSGAILLTGGWG